MSYFKEDYINSMKINYLDLKFCSNKNYGPGQGVINFTPLEI